MGQKSTCSLYSFICIYAQRERTPKSVVVPRKFRFLFSLLVANVRTLFHCARSEQLNCKRTKKLLFAPSNMSLSIIGIERTTFVLGF